MSENPILNSLQQRFSNQVQLAFYPYFVLTIIGEHGTASREQIRDEIQSRTSGTMKQSETSHAHLLGRLDKTFGLIQKTDHNQADPIYALTADGKKILANSNKEVIRPLTKALSK